MALPNWTESQILNQLNSGYKWTGPNITYAFPTAIAGMATTFGEGNFTTLSAAARTQAQLALGLWDDLIVPDTQLVAPGNYQTTNIEFGMGLANVDYAHAYYPTVGSVWFNPSFSGSADLKSPTVGQHSFASYIHEIGHALGLEHMGDYENSSSPSSFQDSTVYSIMSYYGPSWGGTASNGLDLVAWADWTSANGKLYSPQTPMLNDIVAIQSIYGIETTTRTGDTVYGFNSNVTGAAGDIFNFARNANPVLTIFDSAGTDTLDVSGWSTTSVISLVSGTFSSTNNMTNNIAIAHSSTIENARTGSGNDTIYGNQFSNLLEGGVGDDKLIGGGGGDHLSGGAGFDYVDYAAATDGVQVDIGLSNGVGGDAQGDSYSGIEGVSSTNATDGVWGTWGNDVVYSWSGNDFVDLRDGDDIAWCGSGQDMATGGLGNDMLFGEQGGDCLNGRDGQDVLRGGEGQDSLGGDAGSDVIDGGTENDWLWGGLGSDAFEFHARDLVNGGHDRIMDFQDTGASGADYVKLFTGDISAAQLYLYDQGSSCVIQIVLANGTGSHFIEVLNSTVSQLQDQYYFA